MTTTMTVPDPVKAAATLWFAAVGAGAFEAALAASQLLSAGTSFSELAGGLAIRLAIFTAAVFLALRLRQGHNWARIALAVSLGVFGTVSLVIEPIQWLLAGNSAAAFLTSADALTLTFTASRILHLAAVLGAVTLMFSPTSNAYFRRG
ncbi:hypothetical protein [Nonomuraea africana]|uniref:DUF4149 domain-containing protein n=1 Tax=Nonomuraea africana TaxID=46171 RepID=A0ABR9K7H5_9ACTN|nr:hypothetical protein [Nonomuraea africana]MBE1557957.1 hypothetical protein [Nonomuraea africana]